MNIAGLSVSLDINERAGESNSFFCEELIPFIESENGEGVGLVCGALSEAPIFSGELLFTAGYWSVSRSALGYRTTFVEERTGGSHLLDRYTDGRWALWSGPGTGGEFYPLPVCIRTMWAWMLAEVSGLLVHSSSLSFMDRGILVPGVSGAGKSTFSLLCESVFPGSVMCDDRSAVRLVGDDLYVYGTPWNSSAGIGRNSSASLGAVLLLKQSSINSVIPVTPRYAADALLATTTVFWYIPELRDAALETLDTVLERLPCYELSFRPEPAAVDAVISFLADL